ncbi:PadR family transcriptional regulator [Agromyces aerolatus]|uniref:PadR family transcriptional regulator n=1 Tax=Agromyces sp. LY-1074 TaxID=3074080 RepID=UPI002862F14D|nr:MULTISPECIES: helix-turn-helix transcriptional regulator [unclassified Agromyces]MDR5699416.1 helix-turn-helix transcriptional regulator [Agromyces sp. LY-1074]MDR5705712.1 helix-turn-helix transcriptional regulator [Agromyces sp. LY-1358]
MAHVILGLLLITPQSLYGLIKNFEAGVALFYSASAGSIKRAIDGLLGRGLIEVASVEPGGRGKKIYRVTDAGRREFHDWMTGELTGTDLEAAALPRLFFLGLLDEPERVAVLERIRQRAADDVAKLTALGSQLDAIDVPAEFRAVFAYQRATLDYGIASGEHALAWFGELGARAEDRPAHGLPGR